MKKFEYMIINLMSKNMKKREEISNELGKDGWELVGIDDHIAYFKREIN